MSFLRLIPRHVYHIIIIIFPVSAQPNNAEHSQWNQLYLGTNVKITMMDDEILCSSRLVLSPMGLAGRVCWESNYRYRPGFWQSLLYGDHQLDYPVWINSRNRLNANIECWYKYLSVHIIHFKANKILDDQLKFL